MYSLISEWQFCIIHTVYFFCHISMKNANYIVFNSIWFFKRLIQYFLFHSKTSISNNYIVWSTVKWSWIEIYIKMLENRRFIILGVGVKKWLWSKEKAFQITQNRFKIKIIEICIGKVTNHFPIVKYKFPTTTVSNLLLFFRKK